MNPRLFEQSLKTSCSDCEADEDRPCNQAVISNWIAIPSVVTETVFGTEIVVNPAYYRMHAVRIATAFFDQFPKQPDWVHEQWCWRHWAPCPLLGANGITATLEVLSLIAYPGLSAKNQNDRMDSLGKVCCHLGDVRMYEIWGKCPPSGTRGDLTSG